MVNMNKEQFKIGVNDPELPEEVKKATQNHGGMTVPDDFFVQFERKMNAVIDAEVMKNQTNSDNRTAIFAGYRKWSAIAAAVLVVILIGAAFQFDWFTPSDVNQPGLMANTEYSEEEELNPATDIYYTSLSDYEVYDLICGL